MNRFIVTIVCVAFCSSVSFGDRPESIAAARKAVAYLKADGQKWMDKRGCVSCHQIPMMLWSLGAIGEAPEYSKQDLAAWNDWSTQAVNFVKPELKESHDEDATLTANIDTMAGLLLAIPRGDDDDWRERFVAKLCAEQAEDGAWKPCGQLPAQKRPQLETRQVTTLWVTLALLRHGDVDFDQSAALAFAGTSEAAKSIERIAVELLVSVERKDSSSVESLRSQLLALQREDGSWGWLVDSPGDAFATGLSLYALGQSGRVDGKAIDRAHAFLIESQTDKGSWRVPGTKANAKGRPTPTANYWGTAWAVVGLVSS
ncbi:MAG: squalene--hopene cyclase [Planctomycetota bacterium]